MQVLDLLWFLGVFNFLQSMGPSDKLLIGNGKTKKQIKEGINMGKNFEITQKMKEEIQGHNGTGPAFVLFDVDCGQGKTTKTLEMIGDDGGTCLYLVPRSALLKSIENICAKKGLNNVTPMTMQTFVTLPDAVLGRYKWVIVDECQQCILDSPYNKGIVQVYRKLARAFSGTACIMLTGTDVGVAEHFKKWYGIDVLVYRNREKYATWLQGNTFGFVPNIDTVVDIICRKLAKNEKVLFFSSNIKNIDYVSEMIPAKTMAVVSRGNADAVRLCGRKRKNVNKLIDNESIPEGISVVCATKCLDTGINLKNNNPEDGLLTTIIIDELCVASALQEINRFRREEGEKIDLYFLLPTGYKVDKNYEKYEKELADYELYANNRPAWVKKHTGKRIGEKGIIYTIPGEEHPEYDVDECYATYCEYMLKTLRGDKISHYKRAVERALGWSGVDMLNAGKKTLEELVGVLLVTKAEKQMLIDLFKEMGNYRSASRLNAILKALKLPYEIQTGKSKQLPRRNGKRHECRSGWMLVRIDQ